MPRLRSPSSPRSVGHELSEDSGKYGIFLESSASDPIIDWETKMNPILPLRTIPIFAAESAIPSYIDPMIQIFDAAESGFTLVMRVKPNWEILPDFEAELPLLQLGKAGTGWSPHGVVAYASMRVWPGGAKFRCGSNCTTKFLDRKIPPESPMLESWEWMLPRVLFFPPASPLELIIAVKIEGSKLSVRVVLAGTDHSRQVERDLFDQDQVEAVQISLGGKEEGHVRAAGIEYGPVEIFDGSRPLPSYIDSYLERHPAQHPEPEPEIDDPGSPTSELAPLINSPLLTVVVIDGRWIAVHPKNVRIRELSELLADLSHES